MTRLFLRLLGYEPKIDASGDARTRERAATAGLTSLPTRPGLVPGPVAHNPLASFFDRGGVSAVIACGEHLPLHPTSVVDPAAAAFARLALVMEP